MKATYIPTRPPESANMPGVTPEQLAAILARYSRSNEGIDVLLEKFGDADPSKIFAFVDYGHASIAGLTGGIAIAIDGISMLLAAKFFEFAQMADGQESSTRYLTLSSDGIPDPEVLGIPSHIAEQWRQTCDLGFSLYQKLLEKLETSDDKDRVIETILRKSAGNEKLKERLFKNYGLDRARYMIPLACRTNMALVASARIWADTLRLVDSLRWPEATAVCRLIRAELEKAAPNMIRHSFPDEAAESFVGGMMASAMHGIRRGDMDHLEHPLAGSTGGVDCDLCVHKVPYVFNKLRLSRDEALEQRANRYSHTGFALKREVVTVQWDRIAIAELRDLNRHRTGFRFSTWEATGFYLPDEVVNIIRADEALQSEFNLWYALYKKVIKELARFFHAPGMQAYGYFMGTQVPFEHTMHTDKFLYEVELRTGLGAHFRYAEHLRQAAEIYFGYYPEVRKYIKIGDAEPE